MAELNKTERTSKRTNESKTRPTGPENPYYKAFGLTHDGEYTLIADAWKAFEIENAHRRQESVSGKNTGFQFVHFTPGITVDRAVSISGSISTKYPFMGLACPVTTNLQLPLLKAW